MKKFKTIGVSILVAACAACLSLAFVACKGGDEKSGNYGAGEEGFYYYDGADSARYMLSLQSGTYMITANNETQYSGSYSYDEETGVVSFTGDSSFTATMGENALSLDMGNSGYSFKAYKYFDVTYVDENGNIVATDSVLNGQSAEAITVEKDGYYFIGWYEDSSNSSEFAFNTSIAGDTTVYGWYIEKNLTATEYEITLDYGDGTTEVVSTMNGAVWTLPSEGILGWWVSATNKSGELTYKYNTGDLFTADTTLFAVYEGIGASVTGSGITWDTSRAGANVSITVIDENGETVLTANPSSSSGIYTSTSFTGLGTGTYTVSVGTDTLTYVVNGLSRVSVSSYSIVVNGDGRVLTFAPVENASGYTITIDGGGKTITEDLGSRTYYNLSSWVMTETGLTITITAYANGYVSSVSEEFSYLLKLDSVTLEMDGDDVVWDRVDGALEYLVTVYGEDEEILDSVYTTDTSYSLKYYDAGTYTISVKPVTDGYWSTETFIYGQDKSTIAAPIITDITSYTITWSEVADAASYVVMINGETYEVTEGTTLNFSEKSMPDATSYEIAVMAVAKEGLDSSYSDTVTATNGGFKSSVRYEKNTIYWDYDVSATYYTVSVNGTVATVSSGNSMEITLNKAGDNEIVVTAYDENGSLGQAEIDVYAYTVTLDPNGASLDGASTLYVAQGDVLNLGTVTKEYADFVSWYTQADYTDGQSDVYEGKGSEVANGSVFTGSRDMYLYAYWTYQYLDVELVLGNGTWEDGTATSVTTKIKYNSAIETLPVPTPTVSMEDFVGWYSYVDGAGTRYTDGLGAWTENVYKGETTLYAFYLTIFSYSKSTYGGETVYAVSVSSQVNISRFTDITVPTDYGGYGLILNTNAFQNCVTLETINIPDTVRYIAVSNDGNRSGSSAFAGCSSLLNVNIYTTESVTEPVYFSSDGVLFRKISDSENGDVEIVYYPHGRNLADYVIPSSVSDENELEAGTETPVSHKVTGIATQVFRDKKISTVTIPSSVTTISPQAFYGNTYLTNVIFEDDGVTSLTIGSNAFIDCTSLTEVTLPSRLTDFDGSAFEGCTALMNVYVNTAASVENAKYTSDSGVLLEDGGTTLTFLPTGRSGEVVTADLTTTNITKIGDDAFAANKAITSVEISASVTCIGESAFENCKGIESLVFKGDDDSQDLTIKTRAFYGCILISEVTLPSNLTTMEEDAFAGCISLTYVAYDARVNNQDDIDFAAGSFGTTNHIKTLYLGKNVPEIDFPEIFDGGMISQVIIEDGSAGFISDEYGVVYGAQNYNIIYCPLAISGDYVVPDEVTAIEAGVFSNRTSMTSITLGAAVNTIAAGAFSGCSSLEAIYVPAENGNFGNVTDENDESDGILYTKDVSSGNLVEILYCPMACKTTAVKVAGTVTRVAHDAFNGDTTLLSISFEDCTTVDFETDSDNKANTFYNCSSLTTVVLPTAMTSIPAYMFYGCKKLESISIPSGVTSIETYAFASCSVLTGDLTDSTNGIKLPEGLVTIADRAFNQCSALAVTIPNTVTTIGEYGFYQCWCTSAARSKVVFETGGTADLTIGAQAFNHMNYCEGVMIPARCVSIGNQTFGYCGMSIYSQTDISITFETGSKLETIPSGAFSTTQLKTITIPDSVVTIEGSFSTASALTEVYFGEDNGSTNLKTIGAQTFNGAKLTSVTIPASVEEIGYQAFYSSSTGTITSLTFASGSQLKTIGYQAFGGASIQGVEIPASVTSLANRAFASCTSLETVTFGTGSQLEKIGYYCFNGCTKLSSVTLPDSLKETGNSEDTTTGGIFNGCTSLETITIPASVETVTAGTFTGCEKLTTVIFTSESALEEIGDGAFTNCTNLTTAYTGETGGTTETRFVFPESSAQELKLGDSIFSGCTSLTAVTLSSNITTIGTAFVGASITNVSVGSNTHYKVDDDGQMLISLDSGENENVISFVFGTLTGAVTGLDGITAIEASAFTGQTGMTSITVPSGVKSIGASAFYGCTGLTEVTFESGAVITGIGEGAFNGCTALTGIEIPSSVEVIGASAFSGCTKISSIEIPSSVTSIGDSAFSGCTALTTVTFAASSALQSNGLGTGVFSGCSSLKSIALPSAITTIPDSFFNGCDLSESSFSGYTVVGDYAFQNVKLTEMSLPNVTSIGSYAFANSSIKKIDLGGSLSSMGTYAFYGSALEEVVWTATPTTISESAFNGCASLKSIEIYSPTTTLGASAFRDCTSLVEVVLPGTLGSISNQYVFYGCTSLEKINLPDGIASLANYTFQNCSSLTSVALPRDLASIGTSVFNGCSSLETVVFNENLTSIGNSAFYHCYALKEVYIPAKCTLIDGFGFADCTSLTYVYIGDSKTALGQSAFDGCTALETVELGPEVTFSSTSVFSGCSSLKNITLPLAVESIPQSTFYGCTSLESIFIPASVSSIALNAFSGCYCDIFVENTEDYVSANWTSGWNGTNTTVYYYSQYEPEVNDDGTGYVGNFWYYDDNFDIVAWTFDYAAETNTDVVYVPYVAYTGEAL